MAKLSRVSQGTWNAYGKILNDFMEVDAAKKVVTWRRFINVPAVYGEDRRVPPYEDIEIEVLLAYNTFRTWSINSNSESGEWDDKDVIFYVSKNYLRENGWVDSAGYFAFDRSRDRFIMDGQVYKPTGDTPASQAKDQDILVTVILKKEELITESRID